MRIVVARDPVDLRLLSLVAEAGRIAVHELAAAMNLDAREVAARLIALSASGLPLLVGVECDQKALRNVVANATQYQQGYQYPPSGQFPVAPQPPAFRPPPPSGAFPVPTGPPPAQPRPYAPRPEPQSPPSGSVPVQQAPRPAEPKPADPKPAESKPAEPQPPEPEPEQSGVDPISIWGPPQSSSWARGDEPTQPATRSRNKRKPSAAKRGTPGDTLLGLGPRGEQAQLKLIELTDPANDLLTGAGQPLADGQRAVLVHLELTNGASTPFPQRADEHLELISADGDRFTRAGLTLPDRPAHRSGIRAGETVGGYTVFVVPANTELKTVRWASGPEDTAAVSWRL